MCLLRDRAHTWLNVVFFQIQTNLVNWVWFFQATDAFPKFKSLVPSGFSMDFYGFLWIFVDFNRFWWNITTLVDGCRLTSVTFLWKCLKVKKLPLDRVLWSSRWDHWIRLDEIYLAVPLKSLWTSIFTRLKRLDTNLKFFRQLVLTVAGCHLS